MAILITPEIKDKCLQLWHGSVHQKINLETKNWDRQWVIAPEDYVHLVDKTSCHKCTQFDEEQRIAKGERDAINEWRLANGLEPK